jgi:hypothetical protein
VHSPAAANRRLAAQVDVTRATDSRRVIEWKCGSGRGASGIRGPLAAPTSPTRLLLDDPYRVAIQPSLLLRNHGDL